MQALKSQYTEKDGYFIRKPKIFTFKDPEDDSDPYLSIKTDAEGFVMAADPKNKKVSDELITYYAFNLLMLVYRGRFL